MTKRFTLYCYDHSIRDSLEFITKLFGENFEFPPNTVLVYDTEPIIKENFVIGIQFNLLKPAARAEYDSYDFNLKSNQLFIHSFAEEDGEYGEFCLHPPPYSYPLALFGIPLKEVHMSNKVKIRCEFERGWFKMFFNIKEADY